MLVFNDEDKYAELYLRICARYQAEFAIKKNLAAAAESLIDFIAEDLDESEGLVDYCDLAQAKLAYLQADEAVVFQGEDLWEKISVKSLSKGIVERLNRLESNDRFKCGVNDDYLFNGDLAAVATALLQLVRFLCKEESVDVTCTTPKLRLTDSSAEKSAFLTIGRTDCSFVPLLDKEECLLAIMQDEELKLAYGVLLLHQFKLNISSQSCNSLSLTIPRVDSDDVLGELDDGLLGQELHGHETVLVVDDEEMIWDILIEHLGDLGYTVLLAGNGREAVETYQANKGEIDLIILDVIMPEMNGREALEKIKQFDPEAKVVISSGFIGDAEASEFFELGAGDFLKKPYKMTELARVIRKNLHSNDL